MTTFPDQLKMAKIHPIDICCSDSNPENYKPNSFLQSLSKIFEKHIPTDFKNATLGYQLNVCLKKEFKAINMIVY